MNLEISNLHKKMIDLIFNEMINSHTAAIINPTINKIIAEQNGYELTEDQLNELYRNELLDSATRLVLNGFKINEHGCAVPSNWYLGDPDYYSDKSWSSTAQLLFELNSIDIESLLTICKDRLEFLNTEPYVEFPSKPTADDLIPVPLDLTNDKNIPITDQFITVKSASKYKEYEIAIDCCKAAIKSLQALDIRLKLENKVETQEK